MKFQNLKVTACLAVMAFATTVAEAQLGTSPLLPGLYDIDDNTFSPNPLYPTGTRFDTWTQAKLELDTWGVDNSSAGDIVFQLVDNTGADFAGTARQMPIRTFSAAGPAIGFVGAWGQAMFTLDQWLGVGPNNRVVIKSHPIQPLTYPVQIDGQDQVGLGFMYQGADFVTVEDVAVKNFRYEAFNLFCDAGQQPQPGGLGDPLASANATNNTIRRCRIHDNGGSGMMLYGNGGPIPSQLLIENNFFCNNVHGMNKLVQPPVPIVDAANSFGRFGHISGRRNATTTIRHNSFYQSEPMVNWANVGTPPAPGPAGVTPCFVGNNSNQGGPYLVVSGNAYHMSNAGVVAGGGFFRYQSPVAFNVPLVADNNVFWDQQNGGAGGPRFATRNGFIIPTLLAYQAPTAGIPVASQELAAIVADPGYVSPPNCDLSIQTGSPCIDMGIAGVLVDVNNSPRTGSAPDIGAHEAPIVGLTAAFSASGTSGPCPLPTSFTDLSLAVLVPAPTMWAWDFENDGTDDQFVQNPFHTYLTPGVFSVKLTVSNGVDTSSIVLNNLINAQPYVFVATSSGLGDLAVFGIPAVGTPGALTGYTFLSLDTSAPVGSGDFLGINFDYFTWQILVWPVSIGDPLHFVVGVPGFFPEVPFGLPPGTMYFVGFPPGLTIDFVQVFLSATGQYVLHTNVSRTTI